MKRKISKNVLYDKDMVMRLVKDTISDTIFPNSDPYKFLTFKSSFGYGRILLKLFKKYFKVTPHSAFHEGREYFIKYFLINLHSRMESENKKKIN